MKILLDENLPRKLKSFLGEHDVHTVTEMGWTGKTNGELLRLLHSDNFETLITADKNLRFQQLLRDYGVAVVVLTAEDNRVQTLKQLIPEVIRTLNFVKPGQIREVSRK